MLVSGLGRFRKLGMTADGNKVDRTRTATKAECGDGYTIQCTNELLNGMLRCILGFGTHGQLYLNTTTVF